MSNWFTQTAADTSAENLPAIEPNIADDGDATTKQGELAVVEAPSEAENRSLQLLGEAERAIAQAKSLDELKGIRNKAEAARRYAQAAGMGLELLNHAAEVKLRAERRAGSILAKLKLHGGDRRDTTSEERLSLTDIGVSKDQSSRWQLAAAVPDREFEKYIDRTRAEQGEVTTAGLLRIARDWRSKQRQRQSKGKAGNDQITSCEVVGELSELLHTERRFACVYLDLPWSNLQSLGTGADDVSSFAEKLAAVRVGDLCEGHAHLHIWADDKSWAAARQIMEAWGFQFRSLLVGLLPLGQPGDWWVRAHEFLLLGVKGELPFMERNLNSWMRVERDASGRASSRVRRIIERVSPGPYLELYGSQPASGWTIVGMQGDSSKTLDGGADDAEATRA